MKRLLLLAAIFVIASAALAHWYFGDRGRFTTAPETTDLARAAVGGDLVSNHDPAAVLRFHPDFRYLGGQKFILYGVADTEQHFFVETTADDRLRSVYWIQYEAYLPNKRYTYDYDDSPLRVTLGDTVFFTDTTVFANDPNRKRKRGTDGAMARQFLADKGYSYPNEVIYARLVYLTDAARNKELMVIFMDDLERYDMTAAELQEDGAHEARWDEIEKAHLARVENTLEVLPVDAAGRLDASDS